MAENTAAPRKPREAHDLASASALLKKAKQAEQKAAERHFNAEVALDEARSSVADLKAKVDDFYRELMGEDAPEPVPASIPEQHETEEDYADEYTA